MTDQSQLQRRLAAALKTARQKQGLSLDAVARLSGVSRSMVSQIERGSSSPTIATLWNLTQALRVDFPGLLAAKEDSGIDVIRSDSTPVIDGAGQGVRIRILSPPETVGRHEIYDLEIDPDGLLDSDPHRAGCRESLTVITGSLRVTSGSDEVRVRAGDTAHYRAEKPHRICADAEAARAFLIVQDS